MGERSSDAERKLPAALLTSWFAGPRACLDGVEGALHRLGVAHVAGHRGRGAARLANGAGRVLEGLRTASQHRHLRTQAAQAQGHGAAEPAAPAGDDRGLAREQVLAEGLEGRDPAGGFAVAHGRHLSGAPFGQAHQQKGGGAVGAEAALGVGEAPLGGGGARSAVDDAALGAEQPRLRGEGANEVDLDLQARAGDARGQGGLDGAGHGGVEQGGGETAVQDAHGVEHRFAGLAFEGHAALLDRGEGEAQRLSHRGPRPLAAQDLAQELEAGDGGAHPPARLERRPRARSSSSTRSRWSPCSSRAPPL